MAVITLERLNTNIEGNDIVGASGGMVGCAVLKPTNIGDNPAFDGVLNFDSARLAGGDDDQGTTGAVKVLILSEDASASDPGGNAAGGTMIFEFTGPAIINSLDFVDQGVGTKICLYDEDGNLIREINVPDGADKTVITLAINVPGVLTMKILLQGGGAIDNLNFTLADPDDSNGDTINSGNGSDTFIGGTDSDVVVGGETADGHDVDTPDPSRTDVDFITYTPGDPESGVVTFVNGSTLTFSEIENTIPCFTSGTLIATPHGARPVEDLKIGDLVQTRDNGIQPIVWAGQKAVTHANLAVVPELRPVRIKAGALGGGLPMRDMLVSPNHRMLFLPELAELYFEQSELLVAARHLTRKDGIDVVNVPGVTYLHIMFEHHEVVLADGAWSESFQPGDYTLKGVGDAQCQEIFSLFPELATETGIKNYSSARRSLKRHEAALVV